MIDRMRAQNRREQLVKSLTEDKMFSSQPYYENAIRGRGRVLIPQAFLKLTIDHEATLLQPAESGMGRQLMQGHYLIATVKRGQFEHSSTERHCVGIIYKA
jgi:hypothetical protein